MPMKISVLEHSMSERIIPKISEYSNSQNKVDASDFFSNHPFIFELKIIREKHLHQQLMVISINSTGIMKEQEDNIIKENEI